MISSGSITGFPRPVGSAFRQHTVYAQRQRDPGHDVPWVVSAIDTLAGPVLEAKNHLDVEKVVATDLARHSALGMPDVIAKAKALLDEPGWKDGVVPECGVKGCSNPRPLWAAIRSVISDGIECLPCRIRTVAECRECGAPDECHYVDDVREWLLAAQLCHTCGTWTKRLAEPEAAGAVFPADGCMYTIGRGTGPKEHRGFGGAEWVITFLDGRTVETSDLWHSGTVPDWFRDRFPVNATLARKESTR